jgi:hypothetical protein
MTSTARIGNMPNNSSSKNNNDMPTMAGLVVPAPSTMILKAAAVSPISLILYSEEQLNREAEDKQQNSAGRISSHSCP